MWKFNWNSFQFNRHVSCVIKMAKAINYNVTIWEKLIKDAIEMSQTNISTKIHTIERRRKKKYYFQSHFLGASKMILLFNSAINSQLFVCVCVLQPDAKRVKSKQWWWWKRDTHKHTNKFVTIHATLHRALIGSPMKSIYKIASCAMESVIHMCAMYVITFETSFFIGDHAEWARRARTHTHTNPIGFLTDA